MCALSGVVAWIIFCVAVHVTDDDDDTGRLILETTEASDSETSQSF
jgi:hypothetical protein